MADLITIRTHNGAVHGIAVNHVDAPAYQYVVGERDGETLTLYGPGVEALTVNREQVRWEGS